MVKSNKTNLSKISKEKDIILISDMKELDNAFKNKQQLIALDNKTKVIGPGSNRTKRSRIPKYFSDFKDEMTSFKNEMLEFKNEMLEFKNEMLEFKNQMFEFVKEQRKFNQYVLDVFKRNNLK